VQQQLISIQDEAPMQTDCNPKLFEFEAVERKSVVASFDGGTITSNAGALLLGQVDQGLGLIGRFAQCFTDRRDPRFVEHGLETLLGQRIFGLALGYEDLNDHDELRKDPALAVLAGKLTARRDDCEALAGKSTLNRLEHLPKRHGAKYHKIDFDRAKADALLVDLFLEAHDRAPGQIVIDLDATDIPLHGHQEGRFFHGYYDHHCYLPLYVFCGRHLLLARQRRSNIDAAAGSVEEVARMVTQIRKAWPRVKIILRADSGFAREALMAWCEANKVDFVFGLARNSRLEGQLAGDLAQARALCEASGKPARVFRDFRWRTLDSWSRERRVVGKAEHTMLGSNPRFVVTSLKTSAWNARALYEILYCARGEAENRIGEQFELFADRASCETMAGNQLRLIFSSFAYVLMEALRRIALKHTQFADAAVNTIRLKLLKIGAQVRTSVRRIHFAMASSCPNQVEFEMAHLYLRRAFSSG
jgi:Transposase DDE domain group 1